MAKSEKSDTGAPAMAAAMMAVNPVATKAWMDIMSESTRFLTERLKQDLETQKAMLACKTPAELLQVQSQFLTSAIEHYSKETARLYKMMSTATETTLKDVQSGHARSYDDVPL